MKISYEDCVFEIELSRMGEVKQIILDRLRKKLSKNYTPPASIQRGLYRQFLKKRLKLSRSQDTDSYLGYARNLLLSKESPTIVDVGSAIGTTTIPLAKKFPQARIFAIEPSPQNISHLLRNSSLNRLSNIVLIATAIDRKSDFTSLRIDEINEGGHHLVYEKNRTLHVCTNTLKSVLNANDIDRCDLLKIDTEGFECSVLESLEDLRDPRVIENIVVEYNPYCLERTGKTGWDLVSLGLERGYRCHVLQTKNEIKEHNQIPNIQKNRVLDFVFSLKSL